MKREIILGTWGISGAFGKRGELALSELLETATELGITTVDTAMVYGGGEVEKQLKRFPHLTIATKVPTIPKLPNEGVGTIGEYYQDRMIVEQVEACLRRLGREAIDILQLHNWHASWCAEEILPTFERLVRAGKVVRTGISLPSNFCGVIPAGFDFVQVPFNLLETWASDYLAAEHHSTVWVRSILAHGALTEQAVNQLALDDLRRDRFLSMKELVTQHMIAAGIPTPSDLKKKAIELINTTSHIDGIIVGCTKPEQLRELAQLLR